MKKILTSILVSIFMIFTAADVIFAAVNNKQINANIKTKRVPAGTTIKLKVLDAISSNNMEVGDHFSLMVIDNVKVDNSVVIPQGSVIRGSVEELAKPAILYKGGVIRLYFDHIVSSTGKQVPFYAGVCNNSNVTYDGALSSKTTYATALSKTAENAKNIIVKPTISAWDKGGELLNGAPKYVFGPITAIVCTPVAGIYFIGDSIADIFKKGEDIVINQGETLQVQLIKPVDMPVY